MEKNLARIGILVVAIILVAVVLGISVLNNKPAATTCTVSGSDSSSFIAHVYGTEDVLSFQYTPKDEKPSTYSISYDILEYGFPIVSEQDRKYDSITPANPIVINVSRQENATYTMNMRIRKNNDPCPSYENRVSVGAGSVE